MSSKFDEDVLRLIDGPNVAILSTLMADGSPKAEPVWIDREGDFVLVATDRKSIKAGNMERDPRVAIAITAFGNPYEQVLIRGRVTDVRDDAELEALDAVSMKYTGAPFPRRKWSKRAVFVIEPAFARYHKLPLSHTPPQT